MTDEQYQEQFQAGYDAFFRGEEQTDGLSLDEQDAWRAGWEAAESSEEEANCDD